MSSLSSTSRLGLGLTIILSLFCLSFIFSGKALGADVTTTNVEERNDFVLEPAKMELFLNPGEKATRYIYVTSRIKKPTKFQVGIEDFVGSTNAENPVLLLGNDRSPYSLKDYLKTDTSEFTLNFGQKIRIPVDIELPQNAAPGGFYASVLVSNAPDKLGTSTVDTAGLTKTISRVGSLLFIRVNGPVNESGSLKTFEIKGGLHAFYPRGDLTFNILFSNTGSVHLVPYGTVSIKNIWGKEIDLIPVDAYFALPQSVRYREVSWGGGSLLGRYTATLNLHRGYGDIVDTQTLSFWVIPWKIIGIIFIVVVIIILLWVFIRKNFEFKRKR